jgi:hypothetical protein
MGPMASAAKLKLRARRDRPRGRRTAERGYEFSPPDVDCHVTLPWGVMPTQWKDYITH